MEVLVGQGGGPSWREGWWDPYSHGLLHIEPPFISQSPYTFLEAAGAPVARVWYGQKSYLPKANSYLTPARPFSES